MTYAWLVENFTKEGKSTGLYLLCQVNMTLTADVNAARKFRRQRTAEFRAADMREARRGDWRAVEHGFDDSKTPNVGIEPPKVGSNDGLGVLVDREETMAYTKTLPTEVGTYRNRYSDVFGRMREQVLFVGYTNASAPRLQGDRPNDYMPRTLKCCQPHEHLHADRLRPAEWGGWWERVETPNS